MKRPNRFILLACSALLCTGCAAGYSKKQVLDSAGQVELRSFQTRSYDTDDKVRVLRSVMATLQDLGFVIDKADVVIGVVSATKLDGYAMSMSVSVRPNGEQMTVRANAQYNLKAIEQPGPYQDFFSALDKGLFLDRNTLANDLPAPAAPSGAASKARVGGGAAGIYAFYGEAEEEINSVAYDRNLWARALVAAEGDEQKRKAKYIELRAEQLFFESGAMASIPKQPSLPRSSIKPADNGRSLAATSVGLRGQATGGGRDLTGHYYSKLTGSYKRRNIRSFYIEQDGDRITGRSPDKVLEIEGVVEGSNVRFKWHGPGNKGRGKFSIDDRGNLSGDYHGDSWGKGEWVLTRIR